MPAPTYRSCPSHCCPRHGCKYSLVGCPVETGKVQPEYPPTNGCEACEAARDDLLHALDLLENQFIVPNDPDWTNFGCPHCGHLETLPFRAGEELPYCTHHGNYAWPYAHVKDILAAQKRESREEWTPMVKVIVMEDAR